MGQCPQIVVWIGERVLLQSTITRHPLMTSQEQHSMIYEPDPDKNPNRMIHRNHEIKPIR